VDKVAHPKIKKRGKKEQEKEITSAFVIKEQAENHDIGKLQPFRFINKAVSQHQYKKEYPEQELGKKQRLILRIVKYFLKRVHYLCVPL
jgi:hypothetical protein